MRCAGRRRRCGLRVNTTVTSLNPRWNNLGVGSGRALAEALRLKTTLTSLELVFNNLKEEVWSSIPAVKKADAVVQVIYPRWPRGLQFPDDQGLMAI